MKEKELDKKRQLTEIIIKIYDLIDQLNEINVPIGLGIPNLRNATENIQKGISSLIDQESTKEENK